MYLVIMRNYLVKKKMLYITQRYNEIELLFFSWVAAIHCHMCVFVLYISES